MKKVYFATGNKGKYESWKETLKQYDIDLLHKEFTFEKELDSPDLAEITCDKVIRAYQNFKVPIISVDSGFYIPSLDGFPGHKVNPALKKYKIKGILNLVEGKGRYCWFEQCIAYLSLEISKPKIFKSITEGIISEKYKGVMKKYLWSELGLIFVPKGESKTLAEMTKDEWLTWRLRRGADSVAAKFGEWYSKR